MLPSKTDLASKTQQNVATAHSKRSTPSFLADFDKKEENLKRAQVDTTSQKDLATDRLPSRKTDAPPTKKRKNAATVQAGMKPSILVEVSLRKTNTPPPKLQDNVLTAQSNDAVEGTPTLPVFTSLPRRMLASVTTALSSAKAIGFSSHNNASMDKENQIVAPTPIVLGLSTHKSIRPDKAGSLYRYDFQGYGSWKPTEASSSESCHTII